MTPAAFQFTTKKGTLLFLNRRVQVAKSGKETTLYFFSRKITDGVAEIPPGKEISESSGMPFLKNKNSQSQAPAPKKSKAPPHAGILTICGWLTWLFDLT